MRVLRYVYKENYDCMEKVVLSQIPQKITLDYLADLVKQMRHAQKRYFATRNREVLAESKRLEAMVDAAINKVYDTQTSLFSGPGNFGL